MNWDDEPDEPLRCEADTVDGDVCQAVRYTPAGRRLTEGDTVVGPCRRADRHLPPTAEWALDLDSHGRPILAHRITNTIQAHGAAHPVRYLLACGASRTHPLTGCWTTDDGSLPLQRQSIHCGAEDAPA